MHPIRHADINAYGCGRWGPWLRCVLFPVALFLLCLILHHSVLSPPASTGGWHTPTSFARLDSTATPIYGSGNHHTPCAHCSGSMHIPKPLTVLTHTLFAMPADTETTDSESTVGKPAKPIFFMLSCIRRASWTSTAVRPSSIPLYLFHQSLLC